MLIKNLGVVVALALSSFIAAAGDARAEITVDAGPAPLFLEVMDPSEQLAEIAPGTGLLVRVDERVIRRAARRLEILHPGGGALIAVLTHHETRRPGDATWFGLLEGTEQRVVLTSRDGAVAGVVFDAEETLELLPVAGGWHHWVRAAPLAVPLCSTEPPRPWSLSGFALEESERAAKPSDEPSRIDVLVLYTPEVREALGAAGAPPFMQGLIDVTNAAFVDSDVAARLVLAATAEIPREETPNVEAMMQWLRSDPWVASVREAHAADLVALIISESPRFPCGMGQIFWTPSIDAPFSVTARPCAFQLFSHEIGHNFGMHHEPENAPPPEQMAFPWSYAHWVEGRFRTIMAYGTECASCPRIRRFSNPEVTHDGIPTGIPDRRDNHRTASFTAPYIAARRGNPSRPPAPSQLEATALSPTEVSLRWLDHAEDETGYQVETTAEGVGGWQRVAELPPDTTAHTVEDLEPETTYRFRVRAIRGGSASSYSNETIASTPAAVPGVPTGLQAEPRSATAVTLRWNVVETAATYEVEVHTADSAEDRAPTSITLAPDGAVVDDLEAATPYTFRVRAKSTLAVSDWSEPASATTAGPDGPCVADASTLCLLGERFEVRARWRIPREPFHHGKAAAQTLDGSQVTGLFTFFTPDNVELVVKMLDGRRVNGAFWLYYGALSDVEYWISVRDTTGGGSRTYHNPPGERCGRGDTKAFVPGPEGSKSDPRMVSPFPGPSLGVPVGLQLGLAEPRMDAPCTPGPETLCLAGGRFRVEVEWENPHVEGSRGAGHVLAAEQNDLTGLFWFFQPSNLELAVKILDGRRINDHFWIFWGGLSDIGYTLRITDTDDGRTHDFEHLPGSVCGGAVVDVL